MQTLAFAASQTGEQSGSLQTPAVARIIDIKVFTDTDTIPYLFEVQLSYPLFANFAVGKQTVDRIAAKKPDESFDQSHSFLCVNCPVCQALQ
ncbi:MAG: hypothetical protein LBT78_05975 [Tannerella sp.]|nr:hypothetical protein [Tannerella sp.]